MTRCNLKDPKRLLILVLVLAVVCVAFVLLLQNGARAYKPPKIAFDGASDDLEETVIVPTLDTPMPKDKNVIWCASFQIAWNEFRDDVIGEPVKIEGAQEIADRLNDSPITTDVLEPGSYYAKAGYVEDAIVERIQKELRARFPDVPTPQFRVDDLDFVAVAYAYLRVSVKFSNPFYKSDEALSFDGVPVTSFGIRSKDRRAPGRLREQVQVLYWSGDEEYGLWTGNEEFALDPCRDSKPYQVILAYVETEATLADTLASLERKMKGWNVPHYGDGLGDQDILLVPNMHWRVDHHFAEIEGADKPLLNVGHDDRWLECAQQLIKFKLDRSGADLRSEARVELEESAGPNPRRFIFDRPFLIVMRKRGAQRPFFVMWVDNAELLCKP